LFSVFSRYENDFYFMFVVSEFMILSGTDGLINQSLFGAVTFTVSCRRVPGRGNQGSVPQLDDRCLPVRLQFPGRQALIVIVLLYKRALDVYQTRASLVWVDTGSIQELFSF
jgi:hypothetical protein